MPVVCVSYYIKNTTIFEANSSLSDALEPNKMTLVRAGFTNSDKEYNYNESKFVIRLSLCSLPGHAKIVSFMALGECNVAEVNK